MSIDLVKIWQESVVTRNALIGSIWPSSAHGGLWVKHFWSPTVCFFNMDLKLFLFTQAFTEHWSDLPPAPLKLWLYGGRYLNSIIYNRPPRCLYSKPTNVCVVDFAVLKDSFKFSTWAAPEPKRRNFQCPAQRIREIFFCKPMVRMKSVYVLRCAFRQSQPTTYQQSRTGMEPQTRKMRDVVADCCNNVGNC